LNKKTNLLAVTALFAAAITIVTYFHISVGSMGGYVHVGDAFIYLAASLLPLPYAIAAAAVGAGLADLLSGSLIWVLPTLIIKPLMAMMFTSRNQKLLNKRNVIAMFSAGIICIVGYAAAEVIILLVSGSEIEAALITAATSAVAGVLQPIASAMLYLIVAYAAGDKIKNQKIN